ncbi:hypothetical protein ACUOFC_12550 [Escherichia sp. TWPC-MK]
MIVIMIGSGPLLFLVMMMRISVGEGIETMNLKQYGKREKRLVEPVGMARIRDLQRHAIDTANLHIHALESEKAL